MKRNYKILLIITIVLSFITDVPAGHLSQKLGHSDGRSHESKKENVDIPSRGRTVRESEGPRGPKPLSLKLQEETEELLNESQKLKEEEEKLKEETNDAPPIVEQNEVKIKPILSNDMPDEVVSEMPHETLPNDEPVSKDKPEFPNEVKDNKLHEEQIDPIDESEELDNGILLVCLGGGEDEVVMANMASLLIKQGHKVSALLYGSGPREEPFPKGMKIYELPLDEEDPMYPNGEALGVTPGEETGVEWLSGRVISSRVLACRALSKASWPDDVARRSKLLVTPLFLHDLCVLSLAQRAGVPTVGVLTSRVGAWWVWEQLGTLPLLSTTSVPPTVMDDSSIWTRTVNIARHYGYLSTLRQQWQVPVLTKMDSSWSPSSLQDLYSNVVRILLAWDPLVHAHTPPTTLMVPVGGFSFETGHMTKDVLVPALLNRAGVLTVSPGGREAWLGPHALISLHEALQPTSYTVLWRTTFPYLKPNITKDINSNAKFVYKEEVPLNDILSHPRHRLIISTCGESEVMAAVAFASPVLCLPVTSDQKLASNQLKLLGVAEVIPAEEITVSILKEKLSKIVTDRGYRQRARTLGEEFHDQSVSAADRLVFSLERVLRKPYSRRYDHKSSNLYLLQQSNADVYLLLLILLTILIGVFIALGIVLLPIILKKQKTKAD